MNVTYIERSPGSWRLRVETGVDGAGKRQFSYETIHGDAEDVARRRFEILQGHEQNTWTRPDKLLFGAFLDQWLTQREALGIIGRGTREGYAGALRAHVKPALGGTKLQAVKGADIQGVYTALLSGPHALAANTVRQLHRVLVVAFKSARKARLIVVNPMDEVTPPKPRKTPPKALDGVSTAKLLGAIVGHWLEPTTILGLGAGLRRGEICGLRWKDIDLDGRRLHVRGQVVVYEDGTLEWKAPKTEAGVRTVSLPAPVLDVLREQRRRAAEHRMAHGLGGGIDDAYVFARPSGAPTCPRRLTRAFSAFCDRAGLPVFTFHGTRHTHITALLKTVGKEGAKSVSQRVGHANVNVTLSAYQTVFEEDDRSLADLAGGMFGDKNATTRM